MIINLEKCYKIIDEYIAMLSRLIEREELKNGIFVLRDPKNVSHILAR